MKIIFFYLSDGVVTEEELAKQPKTIPDPSSTGKMKSHKQQ